MSELTITLLDGFKTGDTVHTEAVLRDPTAKDLVEAAKQAEKPVNTPDGWKMLTSDVSLGLYLLRAQIVRIGDHQGPLSEGEIKLLSARDFVLLQGAVGAMDAARVTEGIEARGRG